MTQDFQDFDLAPDLDLQFPLHLHLHLPHLKAKAKVTPMDPSLSTQRRQSTSNSPTATRSASLSSPSSEENAEEDVEADIDFYNHSKKPKLHVCPFSDSSQMNPCSTHSTPRKRRDGVAAHLNSFRLYGFNLEHPQDDPLWHEWILHNLLCGSKNVLRSSSSRRVQGLSTI